jgi:hypothetical protein
MAEKKKILFAREEKELLLGLVQKYKHVVESKESDVISKAGIAKNQVVFQKRMQVLEEEFLKEKRTLELHLLKNMLSTPK